MKKILSLLLILSVFLGIAIAAELQPIAFPFIGKWNPTEDPTLLDDYGLQDVQNVRKWGKHFKGINGHTIINTTSISAYPYFLNGFHFHKDQPQESHVLVVAADSTTPTASYLYQNSTAIPTAGQFSATTIHTDAAGGLGTGRFSVAPGGNMVYSNGVETLIWGGAEIEPVAFISHSTTLSGTTCILTNTKDYTEEIISAKTTDYASVGAASYPTFFIGYYRPLKGIKAYVLGSNTTTSTLTVAEWAGNQWNNRTATDNTSSGGISLAQTGTVTWTSSADKPRYINGLSLYWYQFTLSAGSATIYYATVDSEPKEIKNIWDGAYTFPVHCWKYDGSTYIDYTDDLVDDLNSTYLDVSSLSTAHAGYLGFTTRMQGLKITMKSGSENSTSTTAMQVSYWNGSGWTNHSALGDGTAIGTISLNKSGIASWGAFGSERQNTISDELPLYYYKLSFGGTLDADTKITEIRGIPYYSPISAYAFSETFQNRLFLFNEYSGEKNKAIYSVANAPDIFNGPDSGSLYFGDKSGIVAAAFVYNVFKAGAYDQLIVTKKNETYRVSGDGPTNWVVKRISTNIGCVAPLSMVACEVSEGAQVDVKTQVAIWQSDKGFVMTDGAAIIPISDDIRCYFDPNDSRYIPTARQSKTVAWYDPSIRSYKALISSGSTATYHNIELEYSLHNKEWTKIYRVDASGADPLQCGFQVFDTNGLGYTYGGNTKGFMYRLENGASFAGTNIASIIHTKDLILDTQAPLFRKSTVKFMRTAIKKKTGGGTVTIAHYGDQVLTVSGSTNQIVPSAFSVATSPYNTQSCGLGPFLYHSFKITSSQSTADGLELTGLGLYVEPYTAMR